MQNAPPHIHLWISRVDVGPSGIMIPIIEWSINATFPECVNMCAGLIDHDAIFIEVFRKAVEHSKVIAAQKLVFDPQRDLCFYVLYNSPLDHPGEYVVRRHIQRGSSSFPDTDIFFKSKNIAEVRERMAALGVVFIHRHAEDDPNIMGTWI